LRRKRLNVSEDQLAALRERKEEVGVDIAEQIRRALEAEMARTPQQTRAGGIIVLEEAARTDFQAYISPELWARVRQRKTDTRISLDKILQIAIARYLGQDESTARLGLLRASELTEAAPLVMADPIRSARRIETRNSYGEDFVMLQRLGGVPCGPWKEALEDAQAYPVPRELAEVMGAREGDLLIPCAGQSMRGAGLPDGGLVVMRPLNGATPEAGAIVLCCVERTNGEWVGTIKFLYRGAHGQPELRDGNLQPYPLPDDTKHLHAVAYLVGVVGKATVGSHTIKGRRSLPDHSGDDDAERALAE
jgi:SOS-response transcriptional repressor LexA